MLDRTIPLVKMDMVEEDDGRVHHVGLVDFSKKHTVVICGAGFPNWEGNFEALRVHCRLSFGNLTMLCVPETPLLNIPMAEPVVQPLLEKFYMAGQEYAGSMTLSHETVAALETPMIPNEEYLRGVNS